MITNFLKHIKQFVENNFLALILIVFFCLICFNNIFHNELLNWDDTTYLTPKYLLSSTLFTNSFQLFYKLDLHISLTLLSFFSQIKLFGNNISNFYIFNIIIHGSNSFLIYIYTYKITEKKELSILTALLFAIHPLKSESVAWAFQRKDLLYTFFSLLSILSFVKYLAKRNLYSITGVLIFGFLASISKIQGLTLPLLLLCTEYFITKKINLKSIYFAFVLFVLQLNTFYFDIYFFLHFLIPLFLLMYNDYFFSNSKFNFKSFNDIIEKHLPTNKYKYKINFLNITLTVFYLIYFFHAFSRSIIENNINPLILALIPLMIIFWSFNIRKSTIIIHGKWLIITTAIFTVAMITIILYKIELSITLKSSYIVLERIIMSSYSLVYYIQKFIMPVNLNVMHPYPDSNTLTSNINYLYSIPISLGLIIFFISAVLNHKKTHYHFFIFGFLFFLINISLVLHIIPIEGKVIVANRYMYLASYGLSFIFVFGTSSLINKISKTKYKTIIFIVFSIYFTLLSYMTHSHNKVFSNSYSFWTNAIQNNNKNHYAYYALALHYYENSNFEKAIELYDKSIQMNKTQHEYYINRANCYSKIDKIKMAFDDFDMAFQLNPNNSLLFYNRGVLNLKIGCFDEAIKDFEEVIKLDSTNINSKSNIHLAKQYLSEIKLKKTLYSSSKSKKFNQFGYYQAQIGNYETALKYLELSLRFDSLNHDAYKNRGNVYAMQKEFFNAKSDYLNALSIDSMDAGIYLNLGNVCYQLNQIEACKHWQKAMYLGKTEAKSQFDRFCK
jgi:tetratricopeptide (TPR) repeat protein